MGIGLGLYICKLIIDACEGDIYYDKAYSIGASFIFTIKALQPLDQEQSGDLTHDNSDIRLVFSENIEDFDVRVPNKRVTDCYFLSNPHIHSVSNYFKPFAVLSSDDRRRCPCT